MNSGLIRVTIPKNEVMHVEEFDIVFNNTKEFIIWAYHFIYPIRNKDGHIDAALLKFK